jgi:hypothetical protein
MSIHPTPAVRVGTVYVPAWKIDAIVRDLRGAVEKGRKA